MKNKQEFDDVGRMRIYEVVKEYSIDTEKLGFPIRARIKKLVAEEKDSYFMWEISHHYRPAIDAISYYFPSVISDVSFNEAERLLFFYIKGFTNDTVANKDF